MSAFLSYVKRRGTQKGPLFCHSDFSAISYRWYSSKFKEITKLCNLDPSLSTHSARIGAASYAAAAGVPEEHIKQMGRWVSLAVKNYIKLPVITLGHVF